MDRFQTNNTLILTELEHDVVMRSPERGQIRENIAAAAALNALQQPKFSLTASEELFEIGIQV